MAESTIPVTGKTRSQNHRSVDSVDPEFPENLDTCNKNRFETFGKSAHDVNAVWLPALRHQGKIKRRRRQIDNLRLARKIGKQLLKIF